MGREKVIKQIEKCIIDTSCIGCPYEKSLVCRHYMLADALAILKEQEAEIRQLKLAIRQPEIVKCKDCRHFEPDGIYTMCYRHNGLSQNEDWFCADGERA